MTPEELLAQLRAGGGRQSELGVPVTGAASQPVASGTPLFPSAPVGASAGGSVGTVMPDTRTLPERAAGAVGSGVVSTLQFGAGLLEPFQATQDLLFAVLAGARDEDRSIADYMADRGENVMAYLPFGERPSRLSGQDLLRVYGVEDEQVLKYGGFGLDVFGDVSMAGAAVIGIGRAARLVTGGARWADDLVALGRNIDDSMSLIPVTRGGVERGIPTVLPQPIREEISSTVEQGLMSLFNLPGLQRVARLTSLGTEASLRVGSEAGAAVMGAVRGAATQADAVRQFGFDTIDRVNAILGPRESSNFWSGLASAVGMKARAMRNAGRGFSTETYDVILRSVRTVGDQRGLAFLDPNSLRSTGRQAEPLFGADITGAVSAGSLTGFADIAREAASVLPQGVRQAGEQFLEDVIKNVRSVAIRNGDDADRAEDALRNVLREVTEADSLAGYQASMIGPIRDTFLRNTAVGVASSAWARARGNVDASLMANRLWLQTLQRGMRGEVVQEITDFTVGYRGSQPITLTTRELFGTENLGEFLRNNALFAELDLTTYIRALNTGHLRRVFGVFQDDRTFKTWTNSLNSGRLVPSAVFSEASIMNAMNAAGFSNEMAIISRYAQTLRDTSVQRLTPGMRTILTNVAGPNAQLQRPSGVTLSRSNMLGVLIDNGIDPRRAARALNTLAGQSSSPAYAALIDKVAEALAKYKAPEGLRPGQGQFMSARQALDSNALDILTELSDPIISISETTGFVANALEYQEFVRRLFNVAREFDLVSVGRRADFDQVPLSGAQFQGFDGMYVHPYIQRMLDRAATRAGARTDHALAQIANRIRGGYLSGPSLIQANIASGLTTSMYLGLSPMAMIANMASVMRDMVRVQTGQIASIADMDEVRHFFPLELSRMGDIAQAQRDVNALRRAAVGAPEVGLRAAFDVINRAHRNFIENPANLIMGGATPGVAQSGAAITARGVGAAFGLQGFVGMESVMKLAAYRTAKSMGYTVSEAAELSRLSTLDYSELPDLIDAWRRHGVLLFPGFSYLIPSRTLRGLLTRPGGAMAVNRMPDAIANMSLTEEEKAILYRFSPDYMRSNYGVPIRVRRGPQGEEILSLFQFARYIPGFAWTESPLGAATPFAESLQQLGQWGDLIDLTASFTNEGVPPLSAKYGGQVFLPTSPMSERIAQTIGFIHNSFAPSSVRNIVSYRAGEGFTGLVPTIIDSMVELPPELADIGYDRNTIVSERIRRDVADEMIGLLFRSVTPFTATGPLSTARATYNRAYRQYQADRREIEEEYRRAIIEGNPERAEVLIRRAEELAKKFIETWQGPTSMYRDYVQSIP